MEDIKLPKRQRNLHSVKNLITARIAQIENDERWDNLEKQLLIDTYKKHLASIEIELKHENVQSKSLFSDSKSPCGIHTNISSFFRNLYYRIINLGSDERYKQRKKIATHE
jgi:hypothetical protein